MKCAWLFLAVAIVTGCAGPQHTLRFHEQVPASLPASRVRFFTEPRTGQKLAVNPFPSITEKDVHEARLELTNAGDAVLLRFDAHGAVELTEMTTRLRGQSFLVLVDDRPVAAVLVDRPIKDGQFLLLGELTDAEAKSLVDSLNKLARRWRDSGDVRLTP